MNPPRLVLLAIVLFYTGLGFLVLSPRAVYSGDIGVKFVQARSLAAQRFTSLDLQYPGGFLDPGREFFPIRAPFVIEIGAETQAIFSPVAAIIQSAAVTIAGIGGMVLTSLAAAAVILYAVMTMVEPRLRVPVLIALGLGSPLWFYAVSGWEHAPAVAFSTVAFALALKSPARAAAPVAGVLLGIGATLRDEVLLMLPGLVLIIWLKHRGIVRIGAAAAGAAVALVAAALLEVAWFERPAAAHLRHAVHLAQSAARLTDAPNPEVPVLAPMTLRERYDTVVSYWMLGYGYNPVVLWYAAGFFTALLVRGIFRSSVGVFIWLSAIAGLAAWDTWDVLTAPHWVAGVLRVAPYMVLAVLPGAASVPQRSWLPAAVAFTTVTYLIVAFAGVDTSGGKSLGPRLLLPLFPLMAVAAVIRIDEYLRGVHRVERWTGIAGAALVVMAVALHVGGTVRAYVGRNADDLKTIRAVAATPDRIVVADDQFTAQLLFPLYYRKILLLADNEELGARLGSRLAANRIPSVVLVTRYSETRITLPPYRRQRTELRGRMTLQYWRR